MTEPVKTKKLSWIWLAIPILFGVGVFLLLFQPKPLATVLDPRDIFFARSGLWLKGFTGKELVFHLGQEGQELRESSPLYCAGGALLGIEWQKGNRYQLKIRSPKGEQTLLLQSPLKPSACVVHLLELEDVLPMQTNESEPNQSSVVRFSTDGLRLALGTQRGYFRVLETATGKTLLDKRITEGKVRAACFSPDGSIVYVGEQTPDGNVYALQISSGKELWRYRLADDLEFSVPDDSRSSLAWAQLPGAYRMLTAPNGDLLVLGLHSWNKEGRPVSRSRLYRFDSATGRPRWSYPEEGPMPLSIPWFDAAFDARRIALVAVEPFNAEPGTDYGPYRPGSLHFLDGETGTEHWFYTFTPLIPHFKKIQIWRSIGVSPDGLFVCASTHDGRAFIFDVEKMESTAGKKPTIWVENLATPIDVAGESVVATTGLLAAAGTGPLFLVGNSFIPVQASSESQETPVAHPSENTLFIYTWQDHRLIWRWPTPNVPSGILLSQGEQSLAITLSHPYQYRKEDVNGFQIFDMYQKTPDERFLYEYRTEGPVAYDQFDLSPDGRWVAVVEIPVKLGDGVTSRGRYRLHIVH